MPRTAETPADAAATRSSAPPVTQRDRALDVARMIAAVIIVVHHAAIYYTSTGGPLVAGRELWVLTGQLTLWARVPFFFFLAGYFAAHSLGKPNAKPGPYVKRRFATLLPPYLFWNIISGSLIFIAIAGGFQVPEGLSVDPLSTLMRITGIGLQPANGSLWFIRDLLICACLAPLLHRLGVWILIPCVGITLCPEVFWGHAYPKPSSLGYFGIGMLLQHVPKGTLSKMFPRPGAAVLMIAVVGIVFAIGNFHLALGGVALGSLGIYLAARFVDQTFPKLSEWMSENAGASFVIFAANAPFFAAMEQAYGKLQFGIPVALYFVLGGVLFFILALASYLAIKRWFPVLLPIVSGGR